MTDSNERINQLISKLDSLQKRHEDYSKELLDLRLEINELQTIEQTNSMATEETAYVFSEKEELAAINTSEETTIHEQFQQQVKEESTIYISPSINNLSHKKSDLEKFIGENLINKIGIAITVFGIAIGTKYSIDNNLISPLTRIIFAYLFGLGLLGVGFKLKSKYENYSAVLVSGAMAIMYFITYSAYSLYHLLPQVMAFCLMVVFTVFTVIAAIHYNRQVIAHIGLVGAYAVPFLLSEGSGKVAILFSYMTIINIGILVLSFKKYWKPLYFTSFGLTWLIYIAWVVSHYKVHEHFMLALTFLSIFFIIFYTTFLFYKLLRKEIYDLYDILLLMANSFIYFGLGYSSLDSHTIGNQFLGLFTLLNAAIHFIVSSIIYRQKLADKNLFYLVNGLVLVFITITIPVQLDGNWVTLLWAGEAALLFWIGRTKQIVVYERLSYPLMILAFASITHDWLSSYGFYIHNNLATRITPILNIHFLSSALFLAAFGFINWINKTKKHSPQANMQQGFLNIFTFIVGAIFIVTLYFTFRLEIATYWDQAYTDSIITIKAKTQELSDTFMNEDLLSFRKIWVINYSLLFFTILLFLNIRKIKNEHVTMINLRIIIFTIVVFLTQGLYALSDLRESYLEASLAQYYHRDVFNLLIRYVSYFFIVLAILACTKFIRQDFIPRNYKLVYDLLLHTIVLWLASSELIHWMDIADSSQSYKLGLSILWGVYALFLITLGIWKKNKSLRIGAFALFGFTLLKLFIYDISHLDTISKTIVFVSLGLLLLIISFLYNKFKYLIADEVSH